LDRTLHSVFFREVPATTKRDSSRSLRIITANVWQPNRRAQDLLSHVRHYQPDVLIVLEANDWWREQMDVLRNEGFTHTLQCPLDNPYGMLLYSRLELRDPAVEYLVSNEVPSMRTHLVLRSGDEVACHWIHPAPPRPTANKESTERDAELIIVGKRVAAKQGIPTVVAGGLNDVAWSATTRLFRKISGLLDPRVGRGFFSSFHAKYPGLRWPLDHVFHSAAP
jgi:endonuclease/exonuclease/phosphatase (EEP) superfamily protein YafD